MLKIIGKFYRFLWIGDDLDAIFDVMKLEISYNVYSNIYIHSLDGFDDFYHGILSSAGKQ